MIYRILYFVGICIMALPVKAIEFDSGKAINLAHEFIVQLRNNKQFSYEDELKFFPELSLYSSALLMQLKYINQQGKWIKRRPQKSPLCELIRMHRDYILLGADIVSKRYFFAGIPVFYNTEIGNRWSIDAQISFIQQTDKKTKQVLFFYRVPQRKIDFPIFINDVDLSDKLGFKIVNGIPVLDLTKLNSLVEYIK